MPGDEIEREASGEPVNRTDGREAAGEKRLALGRRGFIQASAAATAVGTLASRASAHEYSTQDLTLDSFDGTTLAATLYTPDDDQSYPAVLMTHGWGSDRKSDRVTRKAEHYAYHGYNVLTYDSRGFGDSGGEVGLNGSNEVQDAQTLIDWLAGRDDVVLDASGDPRLGMDGYSYSGAIQLLAAAADDRIDAVVPRITWNDLQYAASPNGVVKIGWLTLLLVSGAISTWDWESGSGLDADLWDWYLDAAWNNELPTDAKDAFADRSVAGEIDQVTAPALLIQGWDDALFNTNEALRTYRGLQDNGVETRIAFYEGGHALEGLTVPDSVRDRLNNLALDWMDRHLKGADVSVPQTTLYRKQPGDWATYDQFPPAGVDPSTMYLGDVKDDGYTYIDQGLWDPDTVTFTWNASDDLEIVGRPKFTMWVYNDGPESRLFFEFFHVEGDERQLINDVGESFRVEGDGYQKFEFTFPAFQRFVEKDDAFELDVSVENPFYFDSRDSEGVYVMHSADYPSRFDLPYHYLDATTMDSGTAKTIEVGKSIHAVVDDVPVREGPGTDYSVITDKFTDESGLVVDGPTSADGHDWWKMHWYEDGEGFHGWAAEQYLDGGPRATERLRPGDRVAVDTSGSDLRVRDGPGLGYDVIDGAADGAKGRIVAGPEWAHDDSTQYAWWKVDYDDYATGWSAQDFLTKS